MSDDDYVILYVDDEWANRKVFEANFASKFRLKCVESGEAALEALRTEPVGVIVTDQRMPGMSGNELLERVKQSHPDVVRVVITAWSDVEPILRAVNEGLVARYIVKPWDRADLEEILGWALEIHGRGREQSSVQLRLLQTERLATLGSLAAALFHDVDNVLSQTRNDTERLRQLSARAAPVLAALLASNASGLSPADRESLTALSEELPEISEDLRFATKVMEGISTGVRRMLRSPGEAVEPAEPGSVVEFCLHLFQGGAHSARLDYDGPQSLPRVTMGTAELSQVLLNLLSNAIHAGSRHVVIHAREHDGVVRFTVSDDGPGMEPAVLAKAGSLFFSTRPGGTGLGLAQCKRLVESAGGHLDIDSAPGKGTRISFDVKKAASR